MCVCVRLRAYLVMHVLHVSEWVQRERGEKKRGERVTKKQPRWCSESMKCLLLSLVAQGGVGVID